MKTIPNRLLNKSVTITKFIQTVNNTGDVSNTRTVVSTGVKMRINLNKTNNSEYGNNESGKFATSTHKAFSNIGIDINIGYFIEDGNKTYSVDAIDFEPGGEISHHYEIGITLIQPEQTGIVESPLYIGE
jgi:hypothetical protein